MGGVLQNNQSTSATAGNLKKDIAGVTLTTQRATMINVDKNGKALRPAIIWLDQRKADSTKILPGALRPVLKTINLLDTRRGCHTGMRGELDMPAAAGHLGKDSQVFSTCQDFLLTGLPENLLIPSQIISDICLSTIRHINGRGNTISNGGFSRFSGRSFPILSNLRKFWVRLQIRLLRKPAYRKVCRSSRQDRTKAAKYWDPDV